MRVFWRIIKIALFVLYLAAVAWLCFGTFQSNPEIPRELFGIPIDKCVHFTMFLPFPFLGALAISSKSWWRSLCITTLMANIIAFIFENLQSRITENRVTDPADLNANLLGITLGLLISIIIGLLLDKKK